MSWLDSFLSACIALGCQVNAVSAHIYNVASDFDNYPSYI